VTDSGQALELTEENVEMVLDEIRPYLMAGVSCADTPVAWSLERLPGSPHLSV
jgi:hypothetical protein